MLYEACFPLQQSYLPSISPPSSLRFSVCRFFPSFTSFFFSHHLLYSTTSASQTLSLVSSLFLSQSFPPLPSHFSLPNHSIHMFPIPFLIVPPLTLFPSFWSFHTLLSLITFLFFSYKPFHLNLCKSFSGPVLNIFRTLSWTYRNCIGSKRKQLCNS